MPQDFLASVDANVYRIIGFILTHFVGPNEKDFLNPVEELPKTLQDTKVMTSQKLNLRNYEI